MHGDSREYPDNILDMWSSTENVIEQYFFLFYKGWGISHGNFFCFVFGKIDRSWRNMETYKWKRIVLGALGCMNNADFEKKNIVKITLC